MSNKWLYMPILKWKRGEQDALRFLRADQWQDVTPLIELQPLKVAPVGSDINAALPDYLKKVSEEIIKAVPADSAIAIGTRYVCSDFSKQANLLLAVCRRLKKLIPNQVIPVVQDIWVDSLAGLPPNLEELIKEFPSIVLRVRTDTLSAEQIEPVVSKLAKIVKRSSIHLLLDQFSLVDKKHLDCVDSIRPFVEATTQFKCASVTLGGGSFPINLTGKKQGVTDIPRVEWKIWNQIVGDDNPMKLRYADYTVTNPMPMDEDIDPTKMNPSIAIRYAGNDYWRLFKGQGFKGAATGQLHSLCKLLVTDSVYGGSAFSYGDKEYEKKSVTAGRNGIPWTWRRDATNRHIALVIDSL